MRKFFFTLVVFANLFFAHSEMLLSNEKHASFVSAVIAVGDERFLTGDAQGFLMLHEGEKKFRFQITKGAITALAVSPDKKLLAVSETDNARMNRISVWEFPAMKKKYSKRTNDTIVHISFSSKGTYLIIGTANVGGAVFLRSADGVQMRVLKNFQSMLGSAFTSKSEKTLCVYSPSGNLSYFNLQTGMLKKKIVTEKNLESVRFFANDRFLLGKKNDGVFIVSALTGNTVKQFQAENSFLLTTRSDENALWLSENSKHGFSLFESEPLDNAHFSEFRIVKQFASSEKLSAACKNKSTLFLGSATGNVFSSNIFPSAKFENLSLETKNENEKILDLDSNGKLALYVSKTGLYNLETDEKFFENQEFTNCVFANGKIILFSNTEKKSVAALDLASRKLDVLYESEFPVTSLHANGKFLISVESDKIVRLYNFENRENEIVYGAENITDAILRRNIIFISSSGTKEVPFPLSLVEQDTKTVSAAPVSGKIIFSLSENGNAVFGIQVKENERKTNLFLYEPETKTYAPIFSLNDEDVRAFTFFANGKIFTNIGKDTVHSYALSDKKHEILERSFFLPEKIIAFKDNIVALDGAGSLSWYSGRTLTAFWQKKKSGTWEKREFSTVKENSENGSEAPHADQSEKDNAALGNAETNTKPAQPAGSGETGEKSAQNFY